MNRATWIPSIAVSLIGLVCILAAFAVDYRPEVFAIVGVGLLLHLQVEWALHRRFAAVVVTGQSFDAWRGTVQNEVDKVAAVATAALAATQDHEGRIAGMERKFQRLGEELAARNTGVKLE